MTSLRLEHHQSLREKDNAVRSLHELERDLGAQLKEAKACLAQERVIHATEESRMRSFKDGASTLTRNKPNPNQPQP